MKKEKFKPLFLFEQSKDKFDFMRIIPKSSDLKKLRNENTWNYSDYDTYMEKTNRLSDFESVCFVFLNEVDISEFEIKKEFYEYYGQVPVCALMIRKCDDSEAFIEEFKKINVRIEVVYVEADDQSNEIAPKIVQTVQKSRKTYNEIENNEVKPSFEKYDKDSSKMIEKHELSEVLKELGFEHTPEQLDITFHNVDIDKSGSIDYEEFKRWFFVGMKPYDSGTRTLLKLTSKANGLLDQVNLSQYENDEQNIEVNKHTLAMTFNEQEDWATKVKLALWVYGPQQQLIQKQLKQLYDETCTYDPEKQEGFFMITVEVKFYLRDKAQEYVDAINARLDDVKTTIEEMIGKQSPCTPKVHQQNNCFIIGCTIPVKKSMVQGKLPITEIPENWKKKLVQDQKMQLEFNSGTNFKELFDPNSEVPLADNLNKGMQLKWEISIMEMFKDILLDKFEEFDESMVSTQKGQAVGALIPLLLFTLQGNVKFDFNDLDEIKQHPAMDFLKTSSPQLMESVLNGNITEMQEERINTEEISEESEEGKLAKKGIEVLHIFLDVIKDMNEVAKIDLKANVEDLAMVEFSSESAGCNKTIEMALMSFPYKMLKDQAQAMGIIGGEGRQGSDSD